MSLVLDEHYSPAIARKLCEDGYDAVAVADVPELRALPDLELLRWAQQERRVIVTENTRDFMPLHLAFLGRGEPHAGILFTSPRTYPRRMAAIGRLATALAAFLDKQDDDSLACDIAWL